MSYQSTTPNLGLPQWVLSDGPQMSDFNGAFQDIDNFAGEKGAANGIATLDASGKVVQNPASAGVANGLATLNEHTQLPLSQLPFAYEVGTWTPKLTNYAWNYTGAETVKAATYVKIGRMVTVNAYVSISTVGSGNLMLTGLPFSSLANQDGVFSWILGNNDSINGGVRYHGHARSQGRSMSLFQGNGTLGGNLLAIGNHLVVTGSYMVE